MLFAADYVICDYSAVIFEAAILKKPLFFYTFDYDTYGAARDFYIDYMKEMPGVISDDPSCIADSIKEDKYDLERVEKFRTKVCRETGKLLQRSGCNDNRVLQMSERGS